VTLTFYFRPGCHLCDDMWQQLQEYRKERVFELTPVNVDDDPELQARFGILIPVLASGEQVLCHYYLDPMALVNCLEGSDTV
jgi:thiol-disulfide isomerase/thioredoxin